MSIRSMAPGFVPSLNGGQLAGLRNRLINGNFAVWQRGTSFTSATTPANNDDTYLVDRWVLISDGNDIVDVSKDTDGSLKAEVETANKQFGFVQICEAANVADLIGETVAFALDAKASGISTLRLAILAWTGAADSVTSDVVGTWAGGGTEPTWASNWMREGNVVDLSLGASFARAEACVGDVDAASAKQIAVVVWVDDTDAAVNDTLNLRRAQLERGGFATPFEERPIGQELILCQRYYCALSKAGTVWPVTSARIGANFLCPVEMRATPTASLLTSAPVFNDYTSNFTGSGSSLVSAEAATPQGANVRIDGFSGMTANSKHGFFNQTTPVMAFSAEL